MRRAPSILVAALLLAGLPARAADMDRLVAAYPEHLKEVAGGDLVWQDGTRMPLSDGKPGKTDDEALASPSILDTFRHAYRAGTPDGVPTTDPGRFRNPAFFEKMYGRCGERGFAARLVPVRWLARHGGGTLMATPVNGVARRLQAVSDELDALPERFLVFLKPSAGTFNCRKIAGTDQASAHGYGIAIDVSTQYADYWRWRPGFRNRIPQEIVDVFERHGFIWGGKWAHFDTMHFEYRPEMLR